MSVNLFEFSFSNILQLFGGLIGALHYTCHQEVGLDSIDRILGAVVVIAANAGGAWSPIGAVTTTMLWIHGQISVVQTMKVICWEILPA